MVKNGDSNKAVWFNEYGWNASPPDITDLPVGPGHPGTTGDYTVRGIEIARQNWPWAGVFTIWYLRQVGDIAPHQERILLRPRKHRFVQGTAYRVVQTGGASEPRSPHLAEWGPCRRP